MNLGKDRETSILTQQELKEFLHYDPETGIFTWKIFSNSRVKIGDTAGHLDKVKGYVRIKINGKSYLAHRLAWLYVTGAMPKVLIDHENGIKHDNWFNNLRQATYGQNLQNQNKPQRGNKSGYLGVSFDKRRGKYAAQIKANGEQKFIGYFTTPKLAHEAYLVEKRKYHIFCTI